MKPQDGYGEHAPFERDQELLLSEVLAGDLDPRDPALQRLGASNPAFRARLEELLVAQEQLEQVLGGGTRDPNGSGAEARFLAQARQALSSEWEREGQELQLPSPSKRFQRIAATVAAVLLGLAAWWLQQDSPRENAPDLSEYVLGTESQAPESEVVLEGPGEPGSLGGRRVQWPEVPGCYYHVEVVETVPGTEELRVLHSEELDTAEFLLPELTWPSAPADVSLRIERYPPGARRPEARHVLDLSPYL